MRPHVTTLLLTIIAGSVMLVARKGRIAHRQLDRDFENAVIQASGA
jgi:hypothetical protein